MRSTQGNYASGALEFSREITTGRLTRASKTGFRGWEGPVQLAPGGRRAQVEPGISSSQVRISKALQTNNFSQNAEYDADTRVFH